MDNDARKMTRKYIIIKESQINPKLAWSGSDDTIHIWGFHVYLGTG